MATKKKAATKKEPKPKPTAAPTGVSAGAERQAAVGAEALATALKLVHEVTTEGAALPILACVKLSARDEVLTLEGTNLEQGIVVKVPAATGGKPWTVTVNSRKLKAVVESLKGDVVLTPDDLQLVIRCNGSKVRLVGLSSDEYPPVLTDAKWGATAVVPVAALVAAFKQVSYAASTDTHRSIPAGVDVEINDTTLVFRATDGHRMVRLIMVPPAAPLGPGRAALSNETVKALRAVLRGIEGTVKLRFSDKAVRIDGADRDIQASILEHKFPKGADDILDGALGGKKHARLDVSSVVGALEQCLPLCATPPQVSLTFQPGELVVATESESGAAEVTVACEWANGTLKKYFNADYLLAYLSRLGLPTVKMTMQEKPDSPAAFSADDGPAYVVMPMRGPA